MHLLTIQLIGAMADDLQNPPGGEIRHASRIIAVQRMLYLFVEKEYIAMSAKREGVRLSCQEKPNVTALLDHRRRNNTAEAKEKCYVSMMKRRTLRPRPRKAPSISMNGLVMDGRSCSRTPKTLRLSAPLNWDIWRGYSRNFRSVIPKS